MVALKNWIELVRFKTLSATAVPLLVAISMAQALHAQIRWGVSLAAALSAFCIQMGTNCFNDALDFKKGADREDRLGPKRMTQSGVFSFETVMRLGTLCFGLAIFFGFFCCWQGGWPIVLLGLGSLIAGYAYTGGPYPLAYHGLGEVFVLVFFGWVAIFGMVYLNTGVWEPLSFLVGTQVGLGSVVLIAINHLRDRASDQHSQKKTLAVKLGETWAKRLLWFYGLTPWLLGIEWWFLGYPWVAGLPWLIFPGMLNLLWQLQRNPPGCLYNQFLGQAAILQLGFGFLMSLGWMLTT